MQKSKREKEPWDEIVGIRDLLGARAQRNRGLVVKAPTQGEKLRESPMQCIGARGIYILRRDAGHREFYGSP